MPPQAENPDDPFASANCLGWKIVKSPDPKDVMMDIWFVHGLFGNRDETWTHQPSGTYWPSLLAEDFPKARIIKYGYDASVGKFSQIWHGVDTSGLESYGRDLAYAVHDSRRAQKGDEPMPELDVPIYFIGHSLGGLVIQQALIESLGANEDLHPVATRTAGVIFMGTPNKGSAAATWAGWLVSAIQTALPWWSSNVNSEVIALLKKKSPVCKKVQKEFQSYGRGGKLKNVKLFCFYESKAMLGQMIVPEESAVIRPEHCRPISANHQDMVKFFGKEDPGYMKVKGLLSDWTKAMVKLDKVARQAPKRDEEDEDQESLEELKKMKNKPPNSGRVVAIGATIGRVDGGSGSGVVNLQTTATGGNDMRSWHNKGKIVGQIVYQRDPNDYWDSSDQWASSDDDDDEVPDASMDA